MLATALDQIPAGVIVLMLAEPLIGCKPLCFQTLGLVEHGPLPVLVTLPPLRGASVPSVYSRYSPFEHRLWRDNYIDLMTITWATPDLQG